MDAISFFDDVAVAPTHPAQPVLVEIFDPPMCCSTGLCGPTVDQTLLTVSEMLMAQSTFAFVMYPESTPILEAWRAAQELATVGILPGLVVANFVIPAAATTPFVRARYAMQEKYLVEIGERFAAPLLEIPLLAQEVKGLEMLAALGTLAYGTLERDLQAVPA